MFNEGNALIEQLNQELSNKQRIIEGLENELNEKSVGIEQLTQELSAKLEIIGKREDMLNKSD